MAHRRRRGRPPTSPCVPGGWRSLLAQLDAPANRLGLGSLLGAQLLQRKLGEKATVGSQGGSVKVFSVDGLALVGPGLIALGEQSQELHLPAHRSLIGTKSSFLDGRATTPS